MTLLETFFPELTTPTLRSSIPYNLVKCGDSQVVLEISVPGYSERDLNIEVCENKLKISGTSKDEREYIVKGITQTSFTNTFVLRDDVEVKAASVKNGLLSITLEPIVPESKKPKKIEITH